MKDRLNIILLFSLLPFVSCEKWGGEENHDGRELIYLSARMDGTLKTKVPYDSDNGKPSPENHFNADVWASTTKGVYLHKYEDGWDGTKDVDANGDGNVTEGERAVSVHTKAFFQSDKPQLLSQAIYPPPVRDDNGQKVADPVYFVGLYPQSVDDGLSWSTNDEGKVAIYYFNGTQDLMYAPEVEGKYNTDDNQAEINTTITPTLHFYHLLTRFNVSVAPNLEGGVRLYDIQNAWGKIVGLKIQCWDPNGWGYGVNSLTVDLTKTIDGNAVSGAVTLGMQEKTMEMNFYKTGSDDEFPDGEYAFTEEEEVAYVMCAPVTAVAGQDEYVLIIETQKDGQDIKTTEISINLMEKDGSDLVGTSMGREFHIHLSFNKTRAIAEVVSIGAWETGGQGTGDITD